MDIRKLIGKTIRLVNLNGENTVEIWLGDDHRAYLTLGADCCSESFFTGASDFRGKVESIEEGTYDGIPSGRQEVDSFHTLRINGENIVYWCNSSNGYYDGWLNIEFDSTPPTPTPRSEKKSGGCPIATGGEPPDTCPFKGFFKESE
jgi:hypothetical protein